MNRYNARIAARLSGVLQDYESGLLSLAETEAALDSAGHLFENDGSGLANEVLLAAADLEGIQFTLPLEKQRPAAILRLNQLRLPSEQGQLELTPYETVDAFVRLASRCLEALLLMYGGTERPTVWTGLWLVPRDGGEPVRSGTLPGLGTFQLHGIGCRFELGTGEDVDVDWDDQGRVVFDSWRMWIYAESRADASSVERGALRLAAAEHPSLLEVAHDTFTWQDQRFNVTRG